MSEATTMIQSTATPKRRRLRLKFSLFSLMSLMVIAALLSTWSAAPAKVTIVATLHVEEPQGLITDPSNPHPSPTHYDQFIKTQLALVTSRAVVAPVVDKLLTNKPPLALLANQANPQEFLATEVRATMIEGTNLMKIQLTGNEQAQSEYLLIVEAITQTYCQVAQQQQRSRDQRLLSLLKEEQKRREEALLKLRRKAWDLKQHTIEHGENPDQSMALWRNQQTIQRQQKICDLLAQRIMILKINTAAPSHVQVLGAPSVHQKQ